MIIDALLKVKKIFRIKSLAIDILQDKSYYKSNTIRNGDCLNSTKEL